MVVAKEDFSHSYIIFLGADYDDWGDNLFFSSVCLRRRI